MAKLPPDFVKAPVFDHPTRSTTPKIEVNAKTREIVLRVDDALFAQIEAAALAEKTTPALLAKRLLEEWLVQRSRPVPVASPSRAAPGTSEREPASLLKPTALAARLFGLVSVQLRKFRIVDVSWAWAFERFHPESPR